MKKKTAIIIGAGPAGLTAAYELLQRTDIKPIIFEMSDQIGGISRTVNYKGNRIDIGGHRFFSKSDRVMRWWLDMLPIQKNDNPEQTITYQNKTCNVDIPTQAPDPEKTDKVFLIRNRLSRIFYLRNFFDYPLKLSLNTFQALGLLRMIRIGFSYLRALLLPIKPEKTLEDFFINRFGKELYLTFFKDYTEKVWGVPCTEIGADWGAQRIKGLSITKALIHAVKSLIKSEIDINQKETETSLIERFLYPKFGPGQMWEEVAKKVEEQGGEIHFGWQAREFEVIDNNIESVIFVSPETGEEKIVNPDYLFSTMPVKDLVSGMGNVVPELVKRVSQGLEYRDFMTVGLLVKKIIIQDGQLDDNWIYVQESDVNVGRIQVFNNWSPYMVKDNKNTWLGLEYFCNEDDQLWLMSDENFTKMAIEEMVRLGFILAEDVLDSTIIRQPKAYPGYFGTYNDFDKVKDYLNTVENLFLLGRNGMHKYNNQDHSMLSAMVAVDGIESGITDKDAIWSVNAEQEYHEQHSK